jgi:ABC-type bacteriocin/lantibiotic exporter with double-glycine peptidase domain
MKIVYKNSILAKGSRALELWQQWQHSKTDRARAQKVLDAHMQQVEKTYQELHHDRRI